MDLLVAGEDPVLVDVVGAAIMDFDPARIPSIKLCAENDGIHMDDYRVMGLPIDSVKRAFEPCPTEIYEGEKTELFLKGNIYLVICSLYFSHHLLQIPFPKFTFHEKKS